MCLCVCLYVFVYVYGKYGVCLCWFVWLVGFTYQQTHGILMATKTAIQEMNAARDPLVNSWWHISWKMAFHNCKFVWTIGLM